VGVGAAAAAAAAALAAAAAVLDQAANPALLRQLAATVLPHQPTRCKAVRAAAAMAR